jgi:POT family proton-dependent oligopeptide transporter
VAFGVPGVLMAIATLAFWSGRRQFVHVPPSSTLRLGLIDSLVGVLLFTGFMGIWIFAGEFGVPIWGRAVTAVICVAAGFGVFFYRQSIQADDGFLATLVSMVARGAGATRLAKGADAVDGVRAVFRIMGVFAFISVFWALFDQHASTWLAQAAKMDLHLDWFVFEFDIIAAQTSSANPMLVMLLIPIMLLVVFPALERSGVKVTPLRRMTVGMVLASLAFVATALIERAITGQSTPIPWEWQLIPYAIMTLGEVLVSATGLEFAYTQAPRRMKSTIMSFWNFTVSIGNVLVAMVALLPDLSMENFFWLFAGLMAAAATAFGVIAYFYTYRDYAQGE